MTELQRFIKYRFDNNSKVFIDHYEYFFIDDWINSTFKINGDRFVIYKSNGEKILLYLSDFREFQSFERDNNINEILND